MIGFCAGLGLCLAVTCLVGVCWHFRTSQIRDAEKARRAETADASRAEAEKAEAARRAAEVRRLEDARRAEEARMLEDARRAEEIRMLENERRARRADEVREQQRHAELARLRRIARRPADAGTAPDAKSDALDMLGRHAGPVAWRAFSPEQDRIAGTNAWVYHIREGRLVSETFAVEVRTNRAMKAAGLVKVLVPDPKTLSGGDSPCVLWYAGDILFWQWNEVPGIRFDTTDAVIDVAARLTAGNALLGKLLERNQWTEKLEFWLHGGAGEPFPVKLEKGRLSLDAVFQGAQEAGVLGGTGIATEIARIESQIKELRKALDEEARLARLVEEKTMRLRRLEVELTTRSRGKSLRRTCEDLRDEIEALTVQQKQALDGPDGVRAAKARLEKLGQDLERLRRRMPRAEQLLGRVFTMTVRAR